MMIDQEDEEIVSNEVSSYIDCAKKIRNVLSVKDCFYSKIESRALKNDKENKVIIDTYLSHLDCCTQENSQSDWFPIYYETKSLEVGSLSTTSVLEFSCDRFQKEHNLEKTENLRCMLVLTSYCTKYENEGETIVVFDEFMLESFAITEIFATDELIRILYPIPNKIPLFNAVWCEKKKYFEEQFVIEFITLFEQYKKKKKDKIDLMEERVLQCKNEVMDLC